MLIAVPLHEYLDLLLSIHLDISSIYSTLRNANVTNAIPPLIFG